VHLPSLLAVGIFLAMARRVAMQKMNKKVAGTRSLSEWVSVWQSLQAPTMIATALSTGGATVWYISRMSTSMDTMSKSIDGIKQDNKQNNKQLNEKIDTIHNELNGKIDTSNKELNGKIDTNQKQLNEKMDNIHKELIERVNTTNEKVEANHKELMSKIWQNTVEDSTLRERIAIVETKVGTAGTTSDQRDGKGAVHARNAQSDL
jgi:DNA anti-recombination protein RmuC